MRFSISEMLADDPSFRRLQQALVSSSIKLEKFNIVEVFIRVPCPSETQRLPVARVLTGVPPGEPATWRSKESAHFNWQQHFTHVEGI